MRVCPRKVRKISSNEQSDLPIFTVASAFLSGQQPTNVLLAMCYLDGKILPEFSRVGRLHGDNVPSLKLQCEASLQDLLSLKWILRGICLFSTLGDEISSPSSITAFF